MDARVPAILGGQPAFDEEVLVGRPNIGDRDRLFERLNDALDRRRLTNHGTYVQALEVRLADTLGVRHCIAVCNATIGLELAARALDLRGEVIVPAFTFIATAHALSWIGLTPIFADIDPETCTLDPDSVESKISSRTTGILGVHVFGRACDVGGLEAVARRHNLTLFFDAAHAFRCSYRGGLIGHFGRCEVFSFHATKCFNTLEGGAIVTDDDRLAARLRSMRDFGYGADRETTISVGTNAKMNEFSGAMGLTSLESLDQFICTNLAHYESYRLHLGDIPGISLVPYDAREMNNYQYVVLKVDESAAGLSRDHIREALRAERIGSRPYFHPCCHLMAPYTAAHHPSDHSLAVSENLSQRVLALPTGTGVSADDVLTICHVVRNLMARARDVRERLTGTGVFTPAAVSVRTAPFSAS